MALASPELLDDDRSIAEKLIAPLASLPAEEREAMLAEAIDGLSEHDLQLLLSWEGQARPSQRIDPEDHALLEAIIGGRGSGKTRAGAEAVCDRIEDDKLRHGGFISRTPGDVRRTMIEGPKSGFIACAEKRGIVARHYPARAEIRILDGTRGGAGSISLYSAHQPEALRGPEHDTLWGDEFAAWPRKVDEMGGTAFSNALLGLRLGDDPLGIFTTTPRATPQMREVMTDKTGLWRVRRMATSANAANLAPGFLPSLIRLYGGTRLFAQEVEGLYVEDVEGALWSTPRIEASRVVPLDLGIQLAGLSEADLLLAKIAAAEAVSGGIPWRWVTVDPSFAEDGGGDECGITVGGVGLDRRLYVFGDYSGNLSPEAWADRVAWAWETAGCASAVVEQNGGGKLAAQTLALKNPRMPIEWVNARQGKRARAEPVSYLWREPGELWVPPHQLGQASIVGSLPELEAEMTGWDSRSNVSPNRIDALSWLGWQAFTVLHQGDASWSAESASWTLPV